MTGLIVHPKVAEEMADAAKWYREIDPDLAQRFLDEVYEGIRKAREMPRCSGSLRILTGEFCATRSPIGSFLKSSRKCRRFTLCP
jgi:hypothetical protein